MTTPAVHSPNSSTGRSTIPQLANNDFRSVSAVAEYAEQLRRIGRSLAMECDLASAALYKILQAEGDKLEPFERKRRARRVTRRLKIAAILSHQVSVQSVKFWALFVREYADLLDPKRERKGFNWQA